VETVVSSALVGTTAKQKAEAANFEVFKSASDFAGRPLVYVQWGGDPPEVLCLDAHGSRIEVELVQCVNGSQMAASKAQYEHEGSYNAAQPPANIGLTLQPGSRTT
jgi:hypothetical protein